MWTEFVLWTPAFEPGSLLVRALIVNTAVLGVAAIVAGLFHAVEKHEPRKALAFVLLAANLLAISFGLGDRWFVPPSRSVLCPHCNGEVLRVGGL